MQKLEDMQKECDAKKVSKEERRQRERLCWGEYLGASSSCAKIGRA